MVTSQSKNFSVWAKSFFGLFLERLFIHQLEASEIESLKEEMDKKNLQDEWKRKFWFPIEKGALKFILAEEISFALLSNLASLDEFQQVRADARSCTGHRCPFSSQCSYVSGLKNAKEANIIIANHSLMYNWPRSFPRPAFIIVDEAHRLEEETTRAFSIQMSSKQLEHLLLQLKNFQGAGALFYLLQHPEISGEKIKDQNQDELVNEQIKQNAWIEKVRQDVADIRLQIEEVWPIMMVKVELFFKKGSYYNSDFWNERPFPAQRECQDQVLNTIVSALEKVHLLIKSLIEIFIPYSGRWEAKNLKDPQLIKALTVFERFFMNLEEVMQPLQIFLDFWAQEEPSTDLALSLRYLEKEGLELLASPIDVGKQVYDGLLQTSEAVVMTSATLGHGGIESKEIGVEWPTGYLYVDQKKRFRSTLYLPNVFNYAENAKVYLCSDVPSMHSKDFVGHILSQTKAIVEKLEGRSLYLFSSRVRFEAAVEYLIANPPLGLPLFVQGTSTKVIDEFRRTEGRGILIGMEAFAEGIDLPGKLLQCVFIDKIPDLRLDYVIQKRRDYFDRHIGQEFTQYYLSHRALYLLQKLGRLLRTESDHGGCFVFDSRIQKWKGRTLENFIQLLHPYKAQIRTTELAKSEFFDFMNPPKTIDPENQFG